MAGVVLRRAKPSSGEDGPGRGGVSGRADHRLPTAEEDLGDGCQQGRYKEQAPFGNGGDGFSFEPNLKGLSTSCYSESAPSAMGRPDGTTLPWYRTVWLNTNRWDTT